MTDLYAEKLHKVYSMPVMKLYFYLRKVIRDKSVKQYNSYDSYVFGQLNGIEKKVAQRQRASPNTQDKTLIAGPVVSNSRFVELADAGRISDFFEMIERSLEMTIPLEKRELVRYAKECIDHAEPMRLLSSTKNFSQSYWSIPRLRTYLFIAHISTRDFGAAKALVWKSLLSGQYDSDFLLRALGESYLLDDNEIVQTIGRSLVRVYGEVLTPRQRIFIANLSLASGNTEFATEVAHPTFMKGANIDGSLYLSNIARHHGDYETQLAYINIAFSKFLISQVSLVDSKLPVSVDNLKSYAEGAKTAGGPLVTVAMSTYNSASSVLSALKSISSQDHQNLEILVVDDCSSDNTVEIVHEYIANFDSRVRLLRQDANGGTYRCRNRALSEAKGEYFICNDSDDWAHPQRISLLVERLVKTPGEIACHARLIRCNAGLGIKPRKEGYCHDDPSSLLFRREDVTNAIGYYLPQRVGADSEFVARMKSYFSSSAVSIIDKPLLIADWSRTSLTGSATIGITDGGTMAPERMQLKKQYLREHSSGSNLFRKCQI